MEHLNLNMKSNEFNEVNFSYKIKDEDGLTAIGSADMCNTVNDPQQ